jgi:tRNA(fMet)-specific endonuclease VapC
MYTLDTNVCIALLKGDEGVRRRLLELSPGDVGLTSIVRAELLFGARNSARVEPNLRVLAAFLAPFESVPFDDWAAEQYARLRAQLRRDGTPVGGNDMLIAAIALARDLVVVTRNRSEFLHVAGLRVETW